MSRDGYVDKRGNARDRAARRAWMLAHFDPDLPGQARCRLLLATDCLTVVDSTTLWVDRIEYGGSYARHNIQPACGPCQSRQGGLISASNGNAPLFAEYRAARHAWEQLFEQTTRRSYVPGIIQRERHRVRRGGRREVTDFVEQHPPPVLGDWLRERTRGASAALWGEQRTG